MRLSPIHAQALYRHLQDWDKACAYDRKSVPGKLRATTHLIVASYIEGAACSGSVLAFLRYLDGPLKSVAETSFITAYSTPMSNPERTKSLYTLKNVGYSWKQVRKQVLLWLGSSFSPRLLDCDPRTEEGKLNQLLVQCFIELPYKSLVSEEARGPTAVAARAKNLPDTDEEDDMELRVRLDDHTAFPYELWKVTKWGLSNDHCHPVIQSVYAGWCDVPKQPELTQKLEFIPVDPGVSPEPKPAKADAKTPRTRKKTAIKKVSDQTDPGNVW